MGRIVGATQKGWGVTNAIRRNVYRWAKLDLVAATNLAHFLIRNARKV